ncbi:hypothetical protein [Enterococcus wangshanyuanii]|uniref:Uncharacterized protein n=1 Tax=Enterococcus wangshanyuanii TaxID=2005703 RepID=A0ABQ1NQG8_9ENTE|nr:hypothetical protein [Enterococcus wangshanyuanii]GGC77525.1 hypothetical protein GCM10011573_03990 [Enterococcus wangshanyuanii]
MKKLEMPMMVQIGSTGRNSGKTTIAKTLIEKGQPFFPIYGLKVITISGAKGKCQRGETGCGICTSIDEGYELIEEKNASGSKDTMQLLRAGCEKVYLLKVFYDHLLEGLLAFQEVVPADTVVVCESNSVREVVEPGLFIMMNNQKGMKKTAAKVIDQADLILNSPELPNHFGLIKTNSGIYYNKKDKDRRAKIWG